MSESNFNILLTNDDGIDSSGLQSLYEELDHAADVTVVAPRENQSGIGRSISSEVTVTEHAYGHLVDGTPSDCVIYALEERNLDPDLVVSGCNVGPNLGAYGFGRSGTIGAAMEAAFRDIPAFAVSLYVPRSRFSYDLERTQFQEAANVTAYVAQKSSETDVFTDVDYFNINVPEPDQSTGELRVTRPAQNAHAEVIQEDTGFSFHDQTWEYLEENGQARSNTDFQTVKNGHTSITPLCLPEAAETSLQELTDNY